jgi:HSP20 family protein
MLMRSDPFRDLTPFADLFETRSGPSMAAMDAYRLGDVITVDFDLPGVDPGSIDLQIERGELRLQAQRRRNAPEGAQYLVRERAETTVTRRLMLGDVLDVDHVDAEYHDGILTLRIPMRESAKPRRVDVRHSREDDKQRALTVEST